MEQELGVCIFCRQEKTVERLYLKPTKYVKPVDVIKVCELYNQGDYFTYLTYCIDCGKPEDYNINHFANFIEAFKISEEMQRAYKDNIAMAFKDCFDYSKTLHENANNAAEYFISQLVKNSESEKQP